MNALRKDDSGSTVPNTSEKKKTFLNPRDVLSLRYVFTARGHFVRSLWLSSTLPCLRLYLCLLLASCIACELMQVSSVQEC